MPRQGSLFLLVIAAVALIALVGCGNPAGGEPHVISQPGNGTAVEYSGDRSGEADRKAQEACARQGKHAVPRSMKAGTAGANLRSYDCVP